MNRKYCTISGLVFALVALLQAWRFVLDLPLQVGIWEVPRSLSGIAAVGAGVLAVWGIRSSRADSPGFDRTSGTK